MATRSPRTRPAAPIVLIALLLGLGACSGAAGTSTPVQTWPVDSELLPEATSGSADARLTCDNRPFPVEGLEAPTGAEAQTGPEFDALRAALMKFGSEFPGSETWSWRRAGGDATWAIFLADTGASEPPRWASVDIEYRPNGWQPQGMGQCDPHVVLSEEFGPASWALDPSFPTPDRTTTELHILVWERACSSGAPATGRMSAPVFEYSATTVTITIGVRPRVAAEGEGMACPMPPGTPASLRLSELLGERTLLDGGQVPPAAPSPANG